ncbi:hypothetical protein ACFPH6_15855 [Streptomyces xiangluensis]|uniref:Uncharacterized protein n=1 Tax=Streptomyces xiangluensis TaxID=2665720 RepID=A0ABV8YL31_9ACTN
MSSRLRLGVALEPHGLAGTAAGQRLPAPPVRDRLGDQQAPAALRRCPQLWTTAATGMRRLLECVAQALDDGIIDIWGEWQPVADDEAFLDWREPEADGEVIWDIEVIWDMEEMNRRYGF